MFSRTLAAAAAAASATVAPGLRAGGHGQVLERARVDVAIDVGGTRRGDGGVRDVRDEPQELLVPAHEVRLRVHLHDRGALAAGGDGDADQALGGDAAGFLRSRGEPARAQLGVRRLEVERRRAQGLLDVHQRRAGLLAQVLDHRELRGLVRGRPLGGGAGGHPALAGDRAQRDAIHARAGPETPGPDRRPRRGGERVEQGPARSTRGVGGGGHRRRAADARRQEFRRAG